MSPVSAVQTEPVPLTTTQRALLLDAKARAEAAIPYGIVGLAEAIQTALDLDEGLKRSKS